MSSDNEGSSDESIEYLMNTRERRSNAGNRLQKLLEQEIKDTRARTEALNDDDIDLLFQEDEDDEEFGVESELEENNEEREDEDEDKVSITTRKHTKQRRKSIMSQSEGEISESDVSSIGKEKPVEDEDLMLSSDSDVNASDENEDDEAGEKELQRQERLKKRKKKLPTVIKKRVKIGDSNTESSNKKAHPHKTAHEQYTAESLLTTSRRTSKRASAVANKLKVYEKLAKAEEKRKEIQEKLQRRKEKQERIHKLTQEDRLRIAEQTEKLNLLSLDKFKEQELSKKQTRLALQQRQKLKFKQDELILDYLTTTWQTSPLVEVEDYKYWNEQLQKREKKKKKKYSRRTKKQIEEDNAKALAAAKGEEYNPELSNASPVKNENEESSEVDSKVVSESIDPGTIEETSENLVSNGTSTPSQKNIVNGDSVGDKEDSIVNPVSTNQPDDANKNDVAEDTTITKQVSFVTEPQITMINTNEPPSTVETPKENTPDISNNSSPDSSLTPVSLLPKKEPAEEEEEQVLIYEGPYQQVSKNFVTVYKFSTQTYNHASLDIPDYNFLPKPSISIGKGKQHVEPESMEPVLRSKLGSQDDDAESVYDKKKVALPIVEASLIPDLKFLDGFPSFGEFDKKVTNQVDVEDIKVESIKITTKAPTGIYINNVKKHCFINNKDCQYFDPKLGIPYSDLASYKIIQDIQKPDGGYKWFGFENGGIYLSVNSKHAKGVPEGF